MKSGQNLDNTKKFIRAANYLSVAQIFLKDNFLLDRELEFTDIKPRLLGHWGSCPGVNHVYAHLLSAAKKSEQYNLELSLQNGEVKAAESEKALKTAFILGPGHAFPALQANLFLEGTLADFDKKANRNSAGINYISKNFSWPGGFPSHASPFTPSVILEGGELGYSLSTAFGAVLDNPNLVMVTLIGDGEAETGPIAAAWHLNKIINPRENGVVLPILHLNEYKISGPTVYGGMSNFELIEYFSGAGWQPKIVDEYAADDFDIELEKAFDEAYLKIRQMKNGVDLSSGENGSFIRLPMIIVRSKKGDTGPKIVSGERIEGNSLAHQVPLPKAASDLAQLKELEIWLKSYRFDQLFNKSEDKFGSWLEDFLPEKNNRLGKNDLIDGGEIFSPLKLPELTNITKAKSLSMNALGKYMSQIFADDKTNFRFFSPDETYSNKLDAIFTETSRSWQRKTNPWEKDLSPNGKVSEILSEHSLQGLLQGYILTGRHGALTSYESFAPIISSMMDQYAKFLTQSQKVWWRKPVASLNYILTSTGWRQDHNGFSHQNPGFIDEVLRRQNSLSQVFLPIDDNSALAAANKMFGSTDKINVLVAGKTPEPRFLTLDQAQNQLKNYGVFTKDFYSNSASPDVVIACAGDYVSKEAVAAVQVLRHDLPEIKIRFVNISVLSAGAVGGQIGTVENPLPREEFAKIFPPSAKVIFSFHGYPQTIRAILAEYSGYNPDNFIVRGYSERGSTTTPFDMLARNLVSRYDLAKRVASLFEKDKFVKEYRGRLAKNVEYARENGVDMPEIDGWDFISL